MSVLLLLDSFLHRLGIHRPAINKDVYASFSVNKDCYMSFSANKDCYVSANVNKDAWV
jgi:hypothetical protein